MFRFFFDRKRGKHLGNIWKAGTLMRPRGKITVLWHTVAYSANYVEHRTHSNSTGSSPSTTIGFSCEHSSWFFTDVIEHCNKEVYLQYLGISWFFLCLKHLRHTTLSSRDIGTSVSLTLAVHVKLI